MQITKQPGIWISLAEQRLQLRDIDGQISMDVAVSTAANGAGELANSYCTPRGLHVVRALIGRDAPPNTVFVGRRATGEIYNELMRLREPNRDWILTRIIWLSGLESGKNRLGNVDTMQRYIYIHGCPDELAMGFAASHGCVRMRNDDVIQLFDQIVAGTRVFICEQTF